MNKVFISYSYVTKKGDNIYTGFNNMVCESFDYQPTSEDILNELTNITNKHCIECYGTDASSTTILFWKQLDGT